MKVPLLDPHVFRRESLALSTVVATSLAVNFALLAVMGVRTGGDTIRYVEGAAHLLRGQPLEGMQALFPGYVALVAAAAKAGAGLTGVVLVQIVVAAVATAVIFRLGGSVSSVACGAIAASLFALNVDLARWHLFVLTDSLYIAFVVFATAATHAASERGGWRYAAAVLVVIVAASLRPQGRLLAIAAALYWIARRPVERRHAVARYAAAALMLIAVAVTSGATLRAEAETPARWLGNGVVIWSHEASRLPMPSDPAIDLLAADATSVAPIRYALWHPVATTRLALTRVVVELSHARPFYSRAHNVAVVLLLSVTYVCAAIGFVRIRRQPLAQLIALTIALHLVFVAATFADWDGRFLLYVLPLVNVFAAAAIA